jgi:hypothetical protein
VVRAEFPAIKIILASGHFPAAGRAEHDGFFRKPFDVAELIKHIRKLID